MVWKGDRKMCSSFEDESYKHKHKSRILKCEKNIESKSNGYQVDWDATEVAMKSIPVSKQYWFTKQVSGMIRVQKMMKI